MDSQAIVDRLDAALAARAELLESDPRHETALRLFNGFLEGCPDLVIDLYGRTVVLYNYAEPPHSLEAVLPTLQHHLLAQLAWIRAIVVKTRHAALPIARRGVLVYGDALDRRVRDVGGKVWYALDIQLNQDASLYLDTRNLRAWAVEHLAGKRVLNVFAYTGSLGVAAMVGGASQVIHLDRNRAFLNVAKASYALNGLPVRRADFRAGDFWAETSRLRRAGELFDCVFIDPPFFATAPQGTVDMVNQSYRVINKVRPLVSDGGHLVIINNALFVSGAAHMQMLEALCADGYLSIETLIPVPLDFIGYPQTRLRDLPVDPAPFNHSTKIAILRVRRKQR